MATTIHTRTEKKPRGFQPLAENAYRVLGLPGAATQSRIYEAASALCLSLKLGVEKTFSGDVPWLGHVRRDETEIRDALSRLADPPRRIFERLFWFPEELDVPVLRRLDEVPQAMRKLERAGKNSVRHATALLSIAAVHYFDPDVKNEGAWVRALSFWGEIVEADEFWSFIVAADLKGDFEGLVTYGEVRELRARTLRVVTMPVVSHAKDALVREDFRACRRALSVLRAASLPQKLRAEYENDILAPIEDKIDEACQTAFALARWASESQLNSVDRKVNYDLSFRSYEQTLKPLLKRILQLAGTGSHVARRAFESAASNLYDLATYYGKEGDADTAATLSRTAWRLAPPGSATLQLIETSVRQDDATAHAVADKTEDGYAAALEVELRPAPDTRPELFAGILQPETNKGNASSLMWVALGFMMFVMFSMCNGPGGRSGSTFPPSSMNFNYNYNVAIPQFSPLPRLNPLTFPAIRPVQPPRATSKRKRAKRQPAELETPQP